MRLLVLDDEPIILRGWTRQAERLGVEVLPCTTIEAARAALAGGAVAAVCDFSLVEGDTRLFVAELSARMPVLVSTGHVESARAALAELGLPDSIVHEKTDPPSRLVDKLRAALARDA